MNSVKVRLLILVIISLISMVILYINQNLSLIDIELYNTANNKILSLNIDILQLRHAEKKYFVERDQQYLNKHHSYLQSFDRTLNGLIKLAREVGVKNPDLQGLVPLIRQYDQQFTRLITHAETITKPERVKQYFALNETADRIEDNLERIKKKLQPYFELNLKQSRESTSTILIITASILMLTILFTYQALTHSFTAFLGFFKQAKTQNNHLDKNKIIFSEFQTMAEMANEMIDARKSAEQALKDLNEHLEERVEEGVAEIKALNEEIKATQRDVVFTMGAIGESRSRETANHVRRVAEYSRILALAFGMDSQAAEMLKEVSPMHDIGKIAIPDSILNKAGALTVEEQAIMRTHTTLGYEMLKGSQKPFFRAAATVAYEHHEKWDGTGYPRALKAEDIDILGRITAVADVFDALSSERVYKKAWPDQQVLDYMKEQRGRHFDPQLVDLLLQNREQFFAVREQFKDVMH